MRRREVLLLLAGAGLLRRSALTEAAPPVVLPVNTWVSRVIPAYPGAPGPSYKKHARLACDPVSGLTYVYGGDNCVNNGIDAGRCNSREELYAYDAALNQWTSTLTQAEANQDGFPQGRCVAGFVWDPIRRVIWMMGGQYRYASYYPGLQSGGLWAFNPATERWSREGPDPRQGSVNEADYLGYDPVNDGLVMPRDGQMFFYPLSQVVIGDGQEQALWQTRPFSVQDPYLDGGHNIQHAIDTARRRIVLYAPQVGRTWAYSLATRTTTLLSQQALPMHANYTMVYDSVNDVVALWGGGTQFDPDLADLWVLSPQTNQWAKPVVGGDLPPAGGHPQMTFDSANNTLVLMTGTSGGPEKIYLLRFGSAVATPPAVPSHVTVR